MKIIAIPYSHTLSHISRPLAVARELRERGHDIVFAGESPKKTFIEKQSFQVVPLYEINPDVLYGNIRAGKLQFVNNSDIDRMMAADLTLYDQVRPDLVLSDGRFTAPISCHIAGIRHAAIVNVSSTEYRALPYVPFFDWIPKGLLSRENSAWKMLDRLNLSLEMTVFDRATSYFTTLSRKHGLKKIITATNCLVGKDLTLLPDIPEYFPTRNLPPDYHYIGPITLKQELSSPAWWPPKTGDKPLVYITMGTTGISNFFEIVSDLIRSSEMAAIITTAGQGKRLATLEGSVYVEELMDGDMVMEACDLVVCHGGNGTIYQALQHGKPIVGIPTILDQSFNMRRVEALGVGSSLTWKEFIGQPDSLLKAIRNIKGNRSFTEQAVRVKALLDTYNAPRTAADLIEKMMGSR